MATAAAPSSSGSPSRRSKPLTGHRFDLRQANCSVSTAGRCGVCISHNSRRVDKFVCVTGAVSTSSSTSGWAQRRSDSGTPSRRFDAAVGLSLKRTRPRLPRTGRRLDRHVPVLGAITRPNGKHHLPRPGDRYPWPIPDDLLSDRDAAAPTLDEVRAAGLLPDWEPVASLHQALPKG